MSCVFPCRLVWYLTATRSFSIPTRKCKALYRAVFTLFEQENSAYAVVQRFHQLGLLFPRRSYGGVWDGKLIWGRLTHSRVIGVLANPSYAGTYVFGRYQSCKTNRPHRRDLYSIAPDATRSVACCYSGPPSGLYHLGSIPRQSQTAWQRTGPTARFSLGLHATDSVCCKACCFAAFAGGI